MSIKKCYACEKKTTDCIETSRDIYLCMSCYEEEKINAQQEIEEMYEAAENSIIDEVTAWEAKHEFIDG